ncbi:putative GPI-anchored protein At3g06035 [Apium graveolens]|uniref:putative GPI-anchored protein At3g06035 n=1 Tax=Apium graveolens TaxID=4045 RepID=UPI003D79F391
MASFTHRLRLLTSPLLLASLLLLTSVTGGKQPNEKESLLKGINNFRKSQNVSALTMNKKASCFAKEIAKQLEGESCSQVTDPNSIPGVPDILKKCKINISTTTDAIMLSVCVVNRVPNLVLNNFTQRFYGNYLKSSKYSGAGIGEQNDWTVVVLSTNTTAGSFLSFASTSVCCRLSYLIVFLGLFLKWLID